MKLLVCDVEGTIFKAKYRIEGTEYASTMWQPLAKHLGEAAIDEEMATQLKWKSDGYGSYIEWVEDTIRIHKKYGLRQEDFDALIYAAEYVDGVREFFEKLDRSKYIPVLVSGGFQELVRRAQRELGIMYGYGACEYHFDEVDGRLAAHSLMPCDFDGKYDYIKTLFSVHKLKANEDWVFIGDGKNDTHIARKAPVSIGINPHPELANVVHHIVQDFHQLLELLAEEELIINWGPEAIVDGGRGRSKRQPIPQACQDQGVVPIEEYVKLKLQLEEERNRRNEAEQKAFKRERRKYNQVLIEDDDYLRTPMVPLRELLDEYKVVFFGSKKERYLFQFLNDYHKNLTAIPGVTKNFDTRPMEYADFIFTFEKCMGHTSSWRSDEAKTRVPFADLKRTNIEMIEKAMANVLYRVFSERGKD